MRLRFPHRGFSLLELLVAASLMASIVTAAAMVLRSTQTSWTTHVADHESLEAGYATLRHITRGVRQAESVTAITNPGNTAGSLTALLASGQTVVWSQSGSQVNYGVGAPTSLLAYGVTELSFLGYKADGITTTIVPAEVQSVLCTVKVSLQRSSTPTRTLSSRVWLRAW